MIKRLTILLSLWPLLAPASIQQDINAAKNGGTVILPPTLTLSTSLVIPAGAKNLTLQGAAGGTTIKCSTHLEKQAIQVGVLPQLHNNWMITGSNNIGCLGAKTGEDYVVTLKPVTPGYYVLWDETAIVCAKGPNQSMNHAELLRVINYDLLTCRAYVGQRLGREYVGQVWLAPYEQATCRNITIRGIRFEGKPLDGTAMSEGGIAVGIADGVAIRDCSVVGFRSDAIMTNTSRNVLIDHCSVTGASEGDAGGGYGFSLYRSRFVTVQNSVATECRHSFIGHSGSTDISFRRCRSANGFDLHGYDERRIALLDCTGDGGDVGNDAWLGGAQDVLIQRCTFTESLGFHANVRNVRIVDSEIGGIAIYSVQEGTTPTVGVPAEGYATGIRIDRSTIKGQITTQGARRFGTLSVNNSTIRGWSTLLDLANEPVSGTFLFSKCRFENGPDTVVQLRNQAADFRIGFNACTFTTGARTVFWAAPSFAGKATITNCRYPTGVTFIADQSGWVVASGNTVEGVSK
jgi:hypothetical protein